MRIPHLPTGGLSRRQLRALFLVGLLVGAAGAGIVAAVAPFLSNSVSVQDGPTLHAPTGPAVTIEETADVNLTAPFPAADTVQINSSAGNITATGSNFANVSIDRINGTWTNTSSLELVGKTVTLDPDDKSEVTLEGDLTAFEWRQSMAADDGTVDFTYASSGGSNTATLTGLSATTEYLAADADDGDVLGVATSDGDGDVTFDDLESGSHDVVLETTAGGPTISNRSPEDGGGVSETEVTLAADIDDPDFPNDELDVEITLDGETVHTETITSAQTVSTTEDVPLGGSHTWTVNATDAYGATEAGGEFTFEVPSNITIREEAEPHEIINNATVVVLVSGSEETVDRQTTSTGNISLEGLPVDERYVVVVNAEGYHQRAIHVPSIFDQSSIFLLNESVSSVQNTFGVNDLTGQFDEPILTVEKAVNRSLYDPDGAENYQWTTIGGDRLGAAGELVIDLAEHSRYRLVIENAEGDTRVLGEYTARLDGAITLEVGDITWQNPEGDGYRIEAYQENASDGERIVVNYEDATDETSEFCVAIHERDNASNVLHPEGCEQDLGTFRLTMPVTGSDANTSWVADWSATRDGEEYGGVIPLTGIRELPIPVDADWLGATVYLLLVAALAATPKAAARTGGLLVVAVAMGLAWWGWVAIPAPMLGIAGAIALLGKVADYGTRY